MSDNRKARLQALARESERLREELARAELRVAHLRHQLAEVERLALEERLARESAERETAARLELERLQSGPQISATEAAELLHCTSQNVRHLCSAGRLPGARRVGRDWQIPRESVESYQALRAK